jgi:hypothetical protein
MLTRFGFASVGEPARDPGLLPLWAAGLLVRGGRRPQLQLVVLAPLGAGASQPSIEANRPVEFPSRGLKLCSRLPRIAS